MLRRDFLSMPLPSPDNCRWCGFPLSRGEHGVIRPSDVAGNVGVTCTVLFDVKPNHVPRLDVLQGIGIIKQPRNEFD